MLRLKRISNKLSDWNLSLQFNTNSCFASFWSKEIIELKFWKMKQKVSRKNLMALSWHFLLIKSNLLFSFIMALSFPPLGLFSLYYSVKVWFIFNLSNCADNQIYSRWYLWARGRGSWRKICTDLPLYCPWLHLGNGVLRELKN